MATPRRTAHEAESSSGRRIVALDALRGLAVAAMVLVNNPGSWGHVYAQLSHAPWHGCTAADVVFPLFLFAMGASIPLAPATSSLRIARRAATLFGLGLLLNGFPSYDLGSLRIMGVLQRLALCYLLALPLARRVAPIPRAAILAALLAGYSALLALVPAPDAGAPELTAARSLPSWVDRTLLGRPHLWQAGDYDPEGILSTLGALATTLAGSLAGSLLASVRAGAAAVVLALTGALAAGAGFAWQQVLPLNKSLWTSSFALFTAGIASILLAILVLVGDSRFLHRLLVPLEVFGRNALLLFVASGLLARIIGMIAIDVGGKSRNVKTLLFERILAPAAGPAGGSLLYALALLALLWLALYPLHRKRWYWTA